MTPSPHRVSPPTQRCHSSRAFGSTDFAAETFVVSKVCMPNSHAMPRHAASVRIADNASQNERHSTTISLFQLDYFFELFITSAILPISNRHSSLRNDP